MGVTYYVRAYASNSFGTAYGVQRSFTPKLVIGDSYQGGIIAYIDNTGQHGLIAAPTDQSTGIRWNNGSYITIGATGLTIGTGQSNTIKIIQAQGNGSYAAKLCDDLVLNGYNDWFLPSKDELNILYQNKNLIGGFISNAYSYYWSSSEYDISRAWDHIFSSSSSGQSNTNKNNTFRVRAVRYF